MSRVVVFDYGYGNVRSAVSALQRVGAEVELTADVDKALRADGLVVPGVGAISACMAGLEQTAGPAVVRDRLSAGAPTLGICVGMQVLFDRGEEGGLLTPGLGVVPGVVTRLDHPVVPHIGWNTVTPPADSLMWRGIEGEYVYFVHSYAVRETKSEALPGFCTYGERFVASIEQPGLWATQFHPEKSGDVGMQLLSNWLTELQ